MTTEIDCGVSSSGVSVLVAVAERVATKPTTGPPARSPAPDPATDAGEFVSRGGCGARLGRLARAAAARRLGFAAVVFVRV
ncbi:hypothetical protein MTX20_10850 [Bradyrhizobium sp. ISRA435]|nr:hypothetical protein MTX20_10850 [Bradyrhizobium sp. ISRA435]